MLWREGTDEGSWECSLWWRQLELGPHPGDSGSAKPREWAKRFLWEEPSWAEGEECIKMQRSGPVGMLLTTRRPCGWSGMRKGKEQGVTSEGEQWACVTEKDGLSCERMGALEGSEQRRERTWHVQLDHSGWWTECKGRGQWWRQRDPWGSTMAIQGRESSGSGTREVANSWLWGYFEGAADGLPDAVNTKHEKKRGIGEDPEHLLWATTSGWSLGPLFKK